MDTHAHHHAEGIDKQKIKSRIKELKQKRDEILASDSRAGLRPVLREIHGLKHALRRATV